MTKPGTDSGLPLIALTLLAQSVPQRGLVDERVIGTDRGSLWRDTRRQRRITQRYTLVHQTVLCFP